VLTAESLTVRPTTTNQLHAALRPAGQGLLRIDWKPISVTGFEQGADEVVLFKSESIEAHAEGSVTQQVLLRTREGSRPSNHIWLQTNLAVWWCRPTELSGCRVRM